MMKKTERVIRSKRSTGMKGRIIPAKTRIHDFSINSTNRFPIIAFGNDVNRMLRNISNLLNIKFLSGEIGD
jgi:hypothetical protein